MPTSEGRAAERGDVVRDVGGAAQPRYSDWKRTTGTGASGEIRVTRPTMKRSSITSPTTSTGRPANRATRSRARPASSAGQRHAGGRTGRRRPAASRHQEQHQHFGVAEVVLEEAGGEQRARWRRARRRRARAAGRRKRVHRSRTSATMNHSQIASAGSPRSAAICSGLLWRCGLIGSRRRVAAILRVQPLDHVRADAGERVRRDHALADVQHRDAVADRSDRSC